jgi:hypothetical protein
MRALWIARYGLLTSAVVWAVTIVLGLSHLYFGAGELLYLFGLLSAFGIGVFAIACVVLQFVVLPALRR